MSCSVKESNNSRTFLNKLALKCSISSRAPVFPTKSLSLNSEISSHKRFLIWLRSKRRRILKGWKNMFKAGSNRDWVYKEAMIVYQFLEVDVDQAARVLSQFDDKEKKKGFKKLALVLHPDKNQHPLSKEAFQKASIIFNQ